MFNDHNVVSQANKSQALSTTRIRVLNISVQQNVLCKMYKKYKNKITEMYSKTNKPCQKCIFKNIHEKSLKIIPYFTYPCPCCCVVLLFVESCVKDNKNH